MKYMYCSEESISAHQNATSTHVHVLPYAEIECAEHEGVNMYRRNHVYMVIAYEDKVRKVA